MRLYREWRKRRRVRVFTVDVAHEELVPIEKYAKKITKAAFRAGKRRPGQ